MNLDNLYDLAEKENIKIYDYYIDEDINGIYLNYDKLNAIALNYKNIENSKEEMCILSEELGHYYMDATYNYTNVDKVLIIATPEYKKRADNRERGVGYETSLITDDLIKDQNRIKFIPIIRIGSKDNSYPIYLGNRKGLYMREDNDYTQALNELIDNIRNY